MSNVEIKVPDLGGASDVEVIELLVSVGDTVSVDDSIITVESDKASMDIPSSTAGEIKEIKIAVGDKVTADRHDRRRQTRPPPCNAPNAGRLP